MIRYGKLLCDAEKDNPSPVLRATYLFSNVGDLVKCYGRMIRFPQDANLYKCEIQLALGDIMMQCRMMLHENGAFPIEITDLDDNLVELEEIGIITRYAARTFNKDNKIESTTQIIISCYALCKIFGWKPLDIEHLGYQHVTERFEHSKETDGNNKREVKMKKLVMAMIALISMAGANVTTTTEMRGGGGLSSSTSVSASGASGSFEALITYGGISWNEMFECEDGSIEMNSFVQNTNGWASNELMLNGNGTAECSGNAMDKYVSLETSVDGKMSDIMLSEIVEFDDKTFNLKIESYDSDFNAIVNAINTL